LKRLVAVVALRPVRLVAPKRSEGGSPAQRLAASQPGEDGRGDGIPLVHRTCSNHPGSRARASVGTAAASAPLWSVRAPVVRLPLAIPGGLGRSAIRTQKVRVNWRNSRIRCFDIRISALGFCARHLEFRTWKSDQVRPSQTFQIYEPDPKPKVRPEPGYCKGRGQLVPSAMGGTAWKRLPAVGFGRPARTWPAHSVLRPVLRLAAPKPSGGGSLGEGETPRSELRTQRVPHPRNPT
jgi:hypothetical protein